MPKKRIKEEKKGFRWRWIVLVIAVFILSYFLWSYLTSYERCFSWTCFNDNLEDCSRTSFIGGTDMIFDYRIEGVYDGKCRVSVVLLQGELNNQESIALEGERMVCDLPLGVIMLPESNIGNCHGTLKESLQDIVISRLHTYIVQNLGKINLEVLDIPEVLVEKSESLSSVNESLNSS